MEAWLKKGEAFEKLADNLWLIQKKTVIVFP